MFTISTLNILHLTDNSAATSYLLWCSVKFRSAKSEAAEAAPLVPIGSTRIILMWKYESTASSLLRKLTGLASDLTWAFGKFPVQSPLLLVGV
jgi:hypothetical protein